MRRREFAALAAGLLAAPLARPQSSGRIARIGLLCQNKCAGPVEEPFLHALRALGWVEGRNLEVERFSAGGDAKALARAAAELAAHRPELIFTVAPPASLAAKKATSSIPIVFAGVANPVEAGLVASLGRPDGNATGLATVPGNVIGKQWEMMKEILPRAARAALLINPDNVSHRAYVEKSLAADAAAARLRVRVYAARSADAIEPAIAEAARDGAEMLVQLGDAVLDGVPGRISQLALHARLPSAYLWALAAKAGGLMSYGPDLDYLLGRGPADYADRILRGANPRTLPVEQPTKLGLVINLKTAKALGLTIPQSLLLRADRVIE